MNDGGNGDPDVSMCLSSAIRSYSDNPTSVSVELQSDLIGHEVQIVVVCIGWIIIVSEIDHKCENCRL